MFAGVCIHRKMSRHNQPERAAITTDIPAANCKPVAT